MVEKLVRVRMTDFLKTMINGRGEELAASAAKARAERLALAYRHAAEVMYGEMRPENARQRAEAQRQQRQRAEVTNKERWLRADVEAFNAAENTAWGAKAPKLKD